jgi:hypothetical protein
MLSQDFADIVACLNRHQVSYLLVGAFAMAHFGYRRATGDIDLFVEPSQSNSLRVMAALREFGAPLQTHQVPDEYFATKGNFYQMGLPPNRIDIITEISGLSFQEAQEQSLTTQIGNAAVPVMSLEKLIHNKRASGRAKDVIDAGELEKLLQSSKSS